MTKHRVGKDKEGEKNCGCGLEGFLSDRFRKMVEESSRFEKDPDDPETLHRFRTSIRRFRSMLGFLGPLCAGSPDRLDLLRREMKPFYRLLGGIRERDVLHADWNVLRPSLPDPWKSLVFPFGADRDRLRSIPAGPAMPVMTSLFDEVRLSFRSGLPDSVRFIASFVRKRLDRLDERIIKGGKSWDSLDPTGRHKLRIEVKNFSDVFDVAWILSPHRVDPYFKHEIGRIKALLGGIHDRDRAFVLLSGFLEDPDPRRSVPAGMLLGWYSERGKAQEERFLRAGRRYRRLRRPWQA